MKTFLICEQWGTVLIEAQVMATGHGQMSLFCRKARVLSAEIKYSNYCKVLGLSIVSVVCSYCLCYL